MADTFTWTSPRGVTVTLPSLDVLPAGVFRKNRKLEPVDFVFTVLEEVSDDEQIAQVDKLGLTEVNDLFEAWQKDTGATVGESSGSST